ncbi:MAG: chromate efflux transporter [Planctomycetota bacterium]
MGAHEAAADPEAPAVPFREALRVWVRVAIHSFGGPAGQIAVMHRLLVEEKKWIGEERFLHALNYCMLLPGPEAQQLATYIGWLLHRTIGGLVAGLLFILPGFVSILLLSILYAEHQDVAVVGALFFGIKPAVLAVVVEAVLRIGRRALKGRFHVLLAGLAFVAIYLFDVPFPAIVGTAALVGFVRGRRSVPVKPAPIPVAAADVAAASRAGERVRLGSSLRVALVCLALWFAPLLVLGVTLGAAHVFVQEGVFFSKAAVVTFGGAYAVLAYVAQRAVETYGWLKPGEMLDGLGMAETTPGPLIQVVQFVGFMAAYRDPGTFSPLVAGAIGAVLVTWVTFVPCFLWIFLGAPYVERLRGRPGLDGALSAITACVVGVILNLALWFALHTLFGVVHEHRVGVLRVLAPDVATLDVAALVLAAGAQVAMFRLRWGMLLTLGASTLLGAAWYLLARGT